MCIVCVLTILNGCGKQEIIEPVECTELTLPDNYCPMAMEGIDEKNQIYVLGYNGDTYDYFVFNKTKQGYDMPKKLEIENEDLILGNLSVSEEGKKAYFWAWNWTANDEPEINIYQGNLADYKLTNIEEIKELNTGLYNLLGDVDSDENLYILNLNEGEELYDTYIASKEGDTYKKRDLDLGISGKYIANVTCLDQNKTMGIIRDNNGNFESIFLSELKDGKSKKCIEVELPEKLQGKEIYDIYINNKSGIIYFIIQKSKNNFLENKLYKMSVKSFLKGAVEEKYQKESCDDYDTGNFQMKLRDKGDMSKKQGIYYEIFVRSFADSDGDGIGDFNGITAKLDYLEELGIEGIWLMPVNASPSYHGYDVTDYNSLNEDYGTESDFKNLIEQAHKRNIKVIMDFVMNHTSSEHPWFQSAIADVNSQYRNYYRWVNKKDTTDYRLSDASSWNSQVWHKSGDYYYYYGIFSEDMPDLNYNNQMVREEMKNAAKKWLTLGVDGFRLDAAMHIYGDYEFKQQKNQLQANLQWWNEFALFCENINPEVYLVGEAWEDEKVLAEYAQPFDTKFNFTFAEDMMNAVINESTEKTFTGKELAKSLQDILQQYQEQDKKYIDGIFATNHDQNRIMSQVNSIEKAKLVASIYLTLPGNPFIYYGEEIGMYGEKPDEKIREPFQWSSDGSDMDTTWEEGSSNTKTRSLQELKADSTNNIYHHYQKLIAFRKQHQALTNGEFQPMETGKETLLAYSRKNQEEELIVIHNLSKEQEEIQNKMLKAGIILYDDSLEGNEQNKLKEDKVLLAPYSTIVIKKK